MGVRIPGVASEFLHVARHAAPPQTILSSQLSWLSSDEVRAAGCCKSSHLSTQRVQIREQSLVIDAAPMQVKE